MSGGQLATTRTGAARGAVRRGRRLPRYQVVAAACGLFAVVAAGPVLVTHGAAGASVRRPAAVLRPPPIPTGAYLGIAPKFAPKETVSSQAFQFEQETGKTLGIVSYYVDFGQMPPFADITKVAATGSLPMVSMKCGPADASIAAGQYDSELRTVAEGFKSYGGPVLFRWFWEMNLPAVNGHAACLGSAGGPGYIAAWRRIWGIFHDVGATNVAFVWCPSAAHGVHHRFDSTFYPGNAYVDWIGFDMYDRTTVNGPFALQITSFYWHWTHVTGGKPMIYCETGAETSLDQQTWLREIADALTDRLPDVPGTPFTDIHGVVYWDGVGIYDYVLEPKTYGQGEYRRIAHEKYFGALVS